MRHPQKKSFVPFVPKAHELPLPHVPHVHGFGRFPNAHKITPGHPGDSPTKGKRF